MPRLHLEERANRLFKTRPLSHTCHTRQGHRVCAVLEGRGDPGSLDLEAGVCGEGDIPPACLQRALANEATAGAPPEGQMPITFVT